MAEYSFLKDAELWVYKVSTNSRFLVPISTISFNQTLSESVVQRNTIQSGIKPGGSSIYKANVGNVTFTTYAKPYASHVNNLLSYLHSSEQLDLYVKTSQDTFKLSGCLLSSISIPYKKDAPLSLDITGEFAKLQRVGTGSYTIPGSYGIDNLEGFVLCRDNKFILDGEDILDNASNFTMELKKELNWYGYTTLQNTLDNGISYPSVPPAVKDISLAGSLQRYLSDTNLTDLQTLSQYIPLSIELGQLIDSTFKGIKLNNTFCSYTNRLQTGNVFTQNYDWRVVEDIATIPLYYYL